MKAGWETKTLGEVCKTASGGTPLKSRKEYYVGGSIPWLMSGEVAQGNVHVATNFITREGLESSSARLFPKDTVLVAMYGATAGQVGILRFEAATNQAICGILPSEKFVPEFLFYLLQAKKDELVAQATGNAQPNISQIKIKNTEVPLLLLPEQQRIVTILDQAFDGIATAKANAEKNLKNAREIFESHLNAVFTQPGEGWSNVLLADICDVRDGTHDSPKYVDDGIPFVTQKNIRDDGLCFEKIKFISGSDHEKFYKRSNVSEGDILISMIGVNRGMACLVDDSRTFSIKNVGLIKLSKKIDMSFLLCYLKSNLAKNYVEAESRGGAQPFIGLKKLREFPVAIAPSTVQISVVQQVEELQLQTQRLESIYQQKLNALDELKKSLLHQAFTGELTAMPDKQLDEALT